MTLYWNLRWFTNFSICHRLFAHFLCTMTVLVWPCRDKKTPALGMEEELTVEVLCLIKNEEEGGLPSLPTFPLIIETQFTQLLVRDSPAYPSVPPHKCPILINFFLTWHSAFHWILSAPTQKNLCSTKVLKCVLQFHLLVNNACVEVFPF